MRKKSTVLPLIGLVIVLCASCAEEARAPEPSDPDGEEQAEVPDGGRTVAVRVDARTMPEDGRTAGPPDAAPSDARAATDGGPLDAAVDSTRADLGGTTPDARGFLDAAADGLAPASSDEIFDPAHLPRFDLAIPPESAAALAQDGRTYVKATFTYGKETLRDVGVHLKGEASFRPLTKKAAFKIKFDEFVQNQRWRGLRRLTLNNMMEDPSFIAERLAYLVFRAAGVPAPRANSALVYVNGTYYGVYANVETEDKIFLKRWFASNEGNLYEEKGKDFLPGNEAMFDLETNEEKNDRSDLTAFIAAIAAAKDATLLADLDRVLDTRHFLKFSALETLVNQWDMYSYTYYWPNNFRLYGDPTTKKFVFLPWGMDMAMKAREGKYEMHVPLFTPPKTGGIVWKRCLGTPECREAYKKVVADLLKTFEAANLGATAERYYMQVKEHVYRDTRKETTNAGFEAGYANVRKVITEKPAFIRAQLQMP